MAGTALAEAGAPTAGAGAGSATASSSSSSYKPALRTGQRVVLQGLEKAKELNGHRGVVMKWRQDAGRYAVRVAGKEMAIKPENLKPEGGAAEAAKFQRKYGNTEGSMYNPVVYSRVPGAGPKVTQWIGQVKAGTRVMVKASAADLAALEPVPLWFGDAGFVGVAPVDVALLIKDVGAEPGHWAKAIANTLNYFPPAAGRLRRDRRCKVGWQIVCNNAGVPLTTASVPPCGLPASEELQSVCLDDRAGGLFDFADEAQAEGYADGEFPLMRLKLVYEEGTDRGVLGVSFHHALCDIFGLSQFLKRLHLELEAVGSGLEAATKDASLVAPCHDRLAAQAAFEACGEVRQEEIFEQRWPLASRALEHWCFLARRLRAALRGRRDGAASVAVTVPASTLQALKKDLQEENEEKDNNSTNTNTTSNNNSTTNNDDHNKISSEKKSDPSSFELLACYFALRLRRLGRRGNRTLVTKEYRAALRRRASGAAPLENLFANVVTHGLSFPLAEVEEDAEVMPMATACASARALLSDVSLDYVQWQSQQDHFKGLPNFFGGLCCNTWGRALADLDFVENYAIGARAVDERAAKMVFPLDAAYLQILPQASGAVRVLLTMPIGDLVALLKDLPSDYFDVPHVSEVRTHAFRVPLPPALVEKLAPSVETHHVVARVACIGDSLTACGYPKYLQALFDRAGLKVEVRNFGVPGVGAQMFAERPYREENRYEQARQWRPHFVVSTLGSNDAANGCWDRDGFVQDYVQLCSDFLERLAPRPALLLVAPPPVQEDGALGIDQEILATEVQEAVRQSALEAASVVNRPLEEQAKRARQQVPPEVLAKVDVLDAFQLFQRRRGYFAEDGVHFNERGTRLLATAVFAELRREVSRCLRRMADAQSVVPENPMGL